MDREISSEFKKILTKQGINFKMGAKVNKVQSIKSGVSINYTDIKNKEDETLEFDKVLVSVGRKPYTEGLNLTKIGIKKDNKGRIEVNEKVQKALAGEISLEYGDNYFFTNPRMQTSSEKYKYLNNIFCVAQGKFSPGKVHYTYYKIDH